MNPSDGRAEGGRQLDRRTVHQRLEVAGEAHRQRGRPERELQDQVPPDDPGDQLAEGGVAERVGAAGHRHRRGELGVAEPGQPAGDRGDEEAQRQRGAGVRGGDRAGEDEDAGADDHADPEDGQVERHRDPSSACGRGCRCPRSTARSTWSATGSCSFQYPRGHLSRNWGAVGADSPHDLGASRAGRARGRARSRSRRRHRANHTGAGKLSFSVRDGERRLWAKVAADDEEENALATWAQVGRLLAERYGAPPVLDVLEVAGHTALLFPYVDAPGGDPGHAARAVRRGPRAARRAARRPRAGRAARPPDDHRGGVPQGVAGAVRGRPRRGRGVRSEGPARLPGRRGRRPRPAGGRSRRACARRRRTATRGTRTCWSRPTGSGSWTGRNSPSATRSSTTRS